MALSARSIVRLRTNIFSKANQTLADARKSLEHDHSSVQSILLNKPLAGPSTGQPPYKFKVRNATAPIYHKFAFRVCVRPAENFASRVASRVCSLAAIHLPRCFKPFAVNSAASLEFQRSAD